MTSVPLGTFLVSVRNGLSVKQSADAGGLPISRIETITDGTINLQRVGRAGIGTGAATKWMLEDGDILMSHINSPAHLAKCALYAKSIGPLIHGMNLLCLKSDRNRALPRYLMHAFRSPDFSAQIRRITNHSVNQSSFSITNLLKLAVPLPPIGEQRRIADILDRVAAIKRKRQEALKLADDFLRATFLDMFGDPITNPKGWVSRPLGQLCTLENGDRSASYPSGSEIRDNGVLFLSTKNIKDGQLSLKDAVYISEQKFRSLRQGKPVKHDILITLRGTLGSCCIYTLDQPAFINAQMMIIRPGPKIRPEYLHALLRSKQLARRYVELSRGAAVPQLTAKQLSEMEICVPPESVQDAFRICAHHTKQAIRKAAESDTMTITLGKQLASQLL